MSDLICRPACPQDLPALKSIWSQVFPGDEPYMQLYYNIFGHSESYLAESDQNPCAMVQRIDGYIFHGNDRHVKGSYIYALGTLPAYRRLGIGEKLSLFACEENEKAGTAFTCLSPATENLRDWYKRRCKAEDIFFHRKIEISAPLSAAPEGVVKTLALEEYSRLREKLLWDYPHMEIPLKCLQLQAEYCHLGGGGLYAFEVNGSHGICLGDQYEGHLVLREMLFPDGDILEAGWLFMNHFGASSAEIRTPAFWHEGMGEIVPDCTSLFMSQIPVEKDQKAYWGFLMD